MGELLASAVVANRSPGKSKSRTSEASTFFSTSLEPKRPDGVNAGVGDCRGWDSPLSSPCPAVENAGDACQHDITPVEVRRSFVEMRESEQHRCNRQRRFSSQPPF